MPELPEVEMVVRTLRPRLVGERIRAVESSGLKLRRAIDLPELERACVGARVEAVRRLGKYWLIDLKGPAGEWVLVGHLGMTGQLLFADARAVRAPHTHAIFHLSRDRQLRYVDPRRFGALSVYPRGEAESAPELALLGVDPLAPAFTVDYLRQQLRRSHRDLKGFLMDQSRIAGLGNIYVCEALFRAGLSPRRRSDRVSAPRAAHLHAAIGEVLERAIANRGTSFSDYVDADGESGANQNELFVYGRAGEPCRRCGARIRRLTQGGRSTFYCPHCQK
jgi:formamidopyrimidine-DNA glycosylase